MPLGRWVLEQAQRRAASPAGPLADFDVAASLPTCELAEPDVPPYVRDALTSGLAPQRLLVEIIGTPVLEDAAGTGAALEALVSIGCRIAIDDTAYNSLRYLRPYPTSALKIDRSFVSAWVSTPSTSRSGASSRRAGCGAGPPARAAPGGAGDVRAGATAGFQA